MHIFSRFSRIQLLGSLLLILLGFAALPASAHSTLPDSTLVKEVSGAKVYYLQAGAKRWIETEAAFDRQGFRWPSLVIVDDGQLADYPDGTTVTDQEAIGLTLTTDLLPDLVPTAPYDLRYVQSGKRTLLKFTATFWNRGRGALELNAGSANASGDGNFPASQRIFQPGGSYRDQLVGVLFWHQIHLHYHYADFGEYVLESIGPAAGQVSLTQKTTFCLRDDASILTPAEGVKQPRTYGGCRGGRQGVSIGWADVYPWTLPDQYFDVTGLAAGTYKMSFGVDPHANFLESRRDNNVASTLIMLDPARRVLRIMGEAASFKTSSNHFDDGTLIQAKGDSKIYVIRGNKRRHILNEEVFHSYGHAWSSVVTLPRTAVDQIALDNLIRLKGDSTVYALNEAGYKRKILDPGVLASYGWSMANVSEINATELAAYPDTDLIRRAGGDRIYSISQRRAVGTNGIDLSSVHIINDTDFDTYATAVVATQLNVPWDLAFLPDGDILFTERPGTLRQIGQHPATYDIPEVLHSGEGGLMGIALHPNFATNHLVYLYFTTAENQQKNRIVRFKLENGHLTQDKMIIDGIPSAIYHDGGQIAFGPDGMLYATTGDANSPDLAQELDSLAGKTLRLTPHGGIPSDNPFGTAVWSYGHRNAQGIAWDQSGRMWATEHGRSGATSGYDELNLIEKGKNYGWPMNQGETVTPGMSRPARHSGPDVTWAPSGLAFADGKLFYAGLLGSRLYEATADASGAIVGFHEHLVKRFGRLRAVVLGPDGYLYLTTSNRDGRGAPVADDDRIIRVYPDFLRD